MLPTGLNEIFGFAAPGYLLTLYAIGGLLALNIIQIDTFSSAALVVLGLPVGYMWSYAVYYPYVWKKCASQKKWAALVQSTGRILADRNLDEKEVAVVHRVYAHLRWTKPLFAESMAFYHVRHHILRSCSVILIVGSPILSVCLLIGGRFSITEVPVLAVALIAMVLLGCLCWSAADREMQTTIEHYEFITSLAESEMRTWTKGYITFRKKYAEEKA